MQHYRLQIVIIPLKPPHTKIIGVNFGDKRILSLCLKTELNSVFGGGVGTCLSRLQIETLAHQIFEKEMQSMALEREVGEIKEKSLEEEVLLNCKSDPAHNHFFYSEPL